jgi:REP element-mobilizing transposase RayT
LKIPYFILQGEIMHNYQRYYRKLDADATYLVEAITNRRALDMKQDSDKDFLLSALERTKGRFAFVVLDFCVLDDHVYLLIKPENGYDLPWIMQQFLSTAARMWNKKHGHKGHHLWRQRFMSRIVQSGEQFRQMIALLRGHVEEVTGKKAGGYKYCGVWHRVNGVKGIVSDVYAFVARYFPELVPLGDVNTLAPL